MKAQEDEIYVAPDLLILIPTDNSQHRQMKEIFIFIDSHNISPLRYLTFSPNISCSQQLLLPSSCSYWDYGDMTGRAPQMGGNLSSYTLYEPSNPKAL